jgi:hypothetical protein
VVVVQPSIISVSVSVTNATTGASPTRKCLSQDRLVFILFIIRTQLVTPRGWAETAPASSFTAPGRQANRALRHIDVSGRREHGIQGRFRQWGGGVECPLYRDGGAIGVSGDMRPGNPEVSEQCATISGLLRYCERDTGTATARKAASVIGDHAIVVCNAGLGPQSEVGIGKNEGGARQSICAKRASSERGTRSVRERMAFDHDRRQLDG